MKTDIATWCRSVARGVCLLCTVCSVGCNTPGFSLVTTEGDHSVLVHDQRGKLVSRWNVDRRTPPIALSCTDDGTLALLRHKGAYGRESDLVLCDIFSGRHIAELGAGFVACAWSTDGHRIAVLQEFPGSRDCDSAYELWILNRDLTVHRTVPLQLRRITKLGESGGWVISWDPQDAHIAVSEKSTQPAARSAILDPDGTQVEYHSFGFMMFVGTDRLVAVALTGEDAWLTECSWLLHRSPSGELDKMRRVAGGPPATSHPRNSLFLLWRAGTIGEKYAGRLWAYNGDGDLCHVLATPFWRGPVCAFTPMP